MHPFAIGLFLFFFTCEDFTFFTSLFFLFIYLYFYISLFNASYFDISSSIILFVQIFYGYQNSHHASELSLLVPFLTCKIITIIIIIIILCPYPGHHAALLCSAHHLSGGSAENKHPGNIVWKSQRLKKKNGQYTLCLGCNEP